MEDTGKQVEKTTGRSWGGTWSFMIFSVWDGWSNTHLLGLWPKRKASWLLFCLCELAGLYLNSHPRFVVKHNDRDLVENFLWQQYQSQGWAKERGLEIPEECGLGGRVQTVET